jgi:holo-[acyl-carrier protein] synthase
MNVPTPVLGEGVVISPLGGLSLQPAGAVGDDRRSAHSIRVGVDLVVVADVAESVDRLGDRYVQRIYTPHEIECCRSSDRTKEYAIESLAARFAAKEAVLKVLRPRGTRPEWRSMEVHRHDDGWCEIRLSGCAATLASEGGISEFAVSLTHERAMAAAVVIARCSFGDKREG